ncbi:type II secretion system F family protein [Rhodococcus sp. X156]|uniref:type II secretion system F family protein n=1 Tax=Rhodococcus sp. X156 TaxID=2499145 RepID=UPI000FDA1A3E|nr:type II secretion system F family protein [Rhodococcus sp. X156]
MTATLALAAALLVLPDSGARARLRGLGHDAAAARRLPTLSAAGVAAAAASVGVLAGGPLPAVAALLLAVTAHRRWRLRRRSREDALASATLVAALEVLVGELRVGAHPAAACAAAAAEVSGPVSVVLAEAAARARLGASAASGLRSRRPGLDAELDRVAAAWRVADERGVALAELLEAVRRDLAGRLRFRSRTEAGLAGARSTAAVLAGLPLLGIALGQAIGAHPVRLLLRDTTGGLLLVTGTVLICAGLAWTGRITARAVR